MVAPRESPILFADLALSRRLERAEGRGCAEFVETRARVFPDSGARWIEVGGTYAMFDTASSPVTQTFGLGMFQPVAPADLDKIEAFFRDCGAPVYHEVSPLADPSALALLNERRYQPFEFTSVMFLPIQDVVRSTAPRNEKIRVRLIGADDEEVYAQTAAKGWSEFAEFADAILDFARLSAKKSTGSSFLAELDGRPIATGALFIFDGVALLAGASTIPEARKQGAQLALLDARLRYAAEHGCDLVMIGAQPGSASQRNAERHGFHIAYTRIKWRLDQPKT